LFQPQGLMFHFVPIKRESERGPGRKNASGLRVRGEEPCGKAGEDGREDIRSSFGIARGKKLKISKRWGGGGGGGGLGGASIKAFHSPGRKENRAGNVYLGRSRWGGRRRAKRRLRLIE